MSVDIRPDEYYELKRLADAAARELGRTKVAHQLLTSTLVRLFTENPQLQRQVLDEIRGAQRGR